MAPQLSYSLTAVTWL